MSKSYRLTAVFLSLMLTACESQEAKLSRLNGDRAVMCLNARASLTEYEAVAKKPYSPKRDSLLKKYLDFNTKCELATRDFDRFMR